MEKIYDFYRTLNQWLTLIENGDNIGSIINSIGNIHNIAIYGMGDMARHIINALKETDIRVVCILDKKSYECYDGLKIETIDACDKNMDLVIYTDSTLTKQVIEDLSVKFKCPVVSLADLVFDNLSQKIYTKAI